MKQLKYLSAALLLGLSYTIQADTNNAKVYFISPANHAVLSSPVTVVMGLSGMGVAPAGTIRDNTGHHHLIIDADTPALGQPIPADEHHKHFGGGQTETLLNLSKGQHTLQLVLGDYAHRPHEQPLVSETISITIE